MTSLFLFLELLFPSCTCLVKRAAIPFVQKCGKFLTWCMPTLKGTVPRDLSSPAFFHQTTSPSPNRRVQKRFWIISNISGVICIRNWLPAVNTLGSRVVHCVYIKKNIKPYCRWHVHLVRLQTDAVTSFFILRYKQTNGKPPSARWDKQARKQIKGNHLGFSLPFDVSPCFWNSVNGKRN